jgi:hypothetical protein
MMYAANSTHSVDEFFFFCLILLEDVIFKVLNL